MDNPFRIVGTTEPPTSRIPRALVLLSFLPLLLVTIGGLLGGLIGGAAAAINVVVARGRFAVPARVAVILGVTAVAVALYVAVAIASVTVPTTSASPLQVGTCLDGVHPGETVTADVTRPVDCATTHDNEIVGVVSDTVPGAYPGQAAVDAFANAPCEAAFSAYVGIDFDSSTLDLITLTPSELSWARGDRQISCVAITRDGSPLTGSVKGSGR
jgi:hypothetical protein